MTKLSEYLFPPQNCKYFVNLVVKIPTKKRIIFTLYWYSIDMLIFRSAGEPVKKTFRKSQLFRSI